MAYLGQKPSDVFPTSFTVDGGSFNDGNITNVGSIALDSIASDAGTGTAITHLVQVTLLSYKH